MAVGGGEIRAVPSDPDCVRGGLALDRAEVGLRELPFDQGQLCYACGRPIEERGVDAGAVGATSATDFLAVADAFTEVVGRSDVLERQESPFLDREDFGDVYEVGEGELDQFRIGDHRKQCVDALHL